MEYYGNIQNRKKEQQRNGSIKPMTISERTLLYGQNIPIEVEFGHDEPKEELEAIVIIEDHKPVAGCRITYPREDIGKIGRVCVVRERQKSGVRPCSDCRSREVDRRKRLSAYRD